MHRNLKKLLDSAQGQSRFVVALFLDVRGFSSFAKLAESSETALFLKVAYGEILNNYFTEASFFKPTGDGLLIILDYSDETLEQVVRDAVGTSVKLVREFSSITSGNPMINFEVPGELGIGLARGAATRLTSARKTLDYSGRPLNVAARLMDLARPSGVVFDRSLGVDLLSASQKRLFFEDAAYLKGIAEHVPMPVHGLSGATTIPLYAKRPINKLRTQVDRFDFTFKDVKDRDRWLHHISEKPIDPEALTVRLEYPIGNPKRGEVDTYETTGEYVVQANEDLVRVAWPPLVRRMELAGIKSTWPIELYIEYQVFDDRPLDEGEQAS